MLEVARKLRQEKDRDSKLQEQKHEQRNFVRLRVLFLWNVNLKILQNEILSLVLTNEWGCTGIADCAERPENSSAPEPAERCAPIQHRSDSRRSVQWNATAQSSSLFSKQKNKERPKKKKKVKEREKKTETKKKRTKQKHTHTHKKQQKKFRKRKKKKLTNKHDKKKKIINKTNWKKKLKTEAFLDCRIDSEVGGREPGE